MPDTMRGTRPLADLVDRWFAEGRLVGGERPAAEADAATSTASRAADTGLQLTGVQDDSRAVAPGNLFVAVPGLRVDGHDFVAEAVSRGAAAVAVERPAWRRVGPGPRRRSGSGGARVRGRLVVRRPEPRAADRRRDRHERQDHDLVPGCGGSRRPAASATGLIGTIGIRDGRRAGAAIASRTPRPARSSSSGSCAMMRDAGEDAVVIETSRHGLAADRVASVDVRRGDLHQPVPRAPRLPRHVRGLPQSEAEPVRAPAARREGRPPGRRGREPRRRARAGLRRGGRGLGRDGRRRTAGPMAPRWCCSTSRPTRRARGSRSRSAGRRRSRWPCRSRAGSTRTTRWRRSGSRMAGGSTCARSSTRFASVPGRARADGVGAPRPAVPRRHRLRPHVRLARGGRAGAGRARRAERRRRDQRLRGVGRARRRQAAAHGRGRRAPQPARDRDRGRFARRGPGLDLRRRSHRGAEKAGKRWATTCSSSATAARRSPRPSGARSQTTSSCSRARATRPGTWARTAPSPGPSARSPRSSWATIASTRQHRDADRARC